MLIADFIPEIIPETLSSSSSEVPTGLHFLSNSLSNFSNSSRTMPPPNRPSSLNFAIRIAYLVIGVVGVIGNLQVTVVMLSYEPLRRRLANYYLVNQCVLDLIVSALIILLYGSDLSTFLNGFLGEINCRLWLSRALLLGLFASSIFSIAALTIERYAEIVYPIQHKIRLNRRMVAYSLIVSNLAGVGFKVSYLAPVSWIVNGVCKYGIFPNLNTKKLVGMLNFLFEYLGPLLVIGFCYAAMARSLNRKVQPTNSKTFSQARKNIIMTLLFIVLLFVACQSLKQVLGLVYYFSESSTTTYSDTLANFALMLSYSNCCFNPLVYFLKYSEFQKGFRWLYCHRRQIENRNRNVPQSSGDDTNPRTTSGRC